MTPAEAVAAIERLRAHFPALISSAHRGNEDGVDRCEVPSYTDAIAAARAARPALSALAGMCVLDVEVVRALLGMATVESGDDCIAREAAEAELRRVVP